MTTHKISPLILILLALTALGLFTVLLHATLYTNPFGADFYTFWLAGRATFAEGQNPYSAEITRQSQMGIYGRPALPDEDQVAFAYPPYSLLAILPTAWMSYDWAQSYWLALNILLLISVLVFLKPGAPPLRNLLYMLFYPVAFGLILGNFAVPLGTFLLFFYAFLIERKPSRAVQIAGGLAFAWVTTKPQFIWLFALFILLYAARERLKPFLISFAISLTGMLAISFVLVPDWLERWLRRIGEYAGYVRSQPAITGLLAEGLPAPMPAILTVVALFVCAGLTIVLLRRWWRGALPALLLWGWLGFLTYLFHPHGIAYEQISFLVPLALWAAAQNGRSARLPLWLFWGGSFLLSWVFFVVGKWVYHPADAWPLIFNGVWLTWRFVQQRRRPAENRGTDGHSPAV